MLYEPLVKLDECLIIDEAMEGIRRSVEPCQLGGRNPRRCEDCSTDCEGLGGGRGGSGRGWRGPGPGAGCRHRQHQGGGELG